MEFKVVMTEDAEADLDRLVSYLLFVKKNEQAARNLLDDFEVTKGSLIQVAGSLKDCTNLRLKEHGYRRINFRNHRYFMLYRIEGGIVVVDNIFHELQDYENQLC
ncbi:type II toxin-antitoxin system RelE/ParE family toxin [Anaerosporobacter sp.]|uniref:type II toxin-antitoxin system RelE/ParE family toxin n=1 Tax=Anaerosporobacter sp. TaxID=1872529 RepID=UPI00286EDCBA|nr:type II toxin-antitoxin system RelE/ParE family toxin [Anaerosporobacter sp.]